MTDERPHTHVPFPQQAPSRAKAPGLKEIAAHLNLSPATVSMVLNDVPLAKSLSGETRARVLAAAKQFNYRPNLLARGLSKRETRTVGVIATESSDGYFTRVMRGIEYAMLQAGYLYFTTSHLGREDLAREYPNALLQRGVDGLIFVNTPVHEDPAVPAVCVSDKCAIPGVTSVLVDQREGMRCALEHLASLGHRRILMMRGAEWSLDADDRYRAMVSAAEQLGLPVSPELTLQLEANQLSPELAYRSVLAFLNTKPNFTAVLAFNDTAALGTIRALRDHGLRCPEDVSVLGVDDVSTAAYMVPRLSTIAQPLEAMGRTAAEQLVAKIRQPQAQHPPRLVYPMTLQVRESTGPAPLSLRVVPKRKRTRVAPEAMPIPATTSAGQPVY